METIKQSGTGKEIAVKYDKLQEMYANQSLLQLSENDLGIGFGTLTLDADGQEVVSLHTMMRLSHSHARKLHTHLTHMITKMDSLKS